MDKLLPCPFCGGKAKVMFRPLRIGAHVSRGTYYVHCKSCLISTQPRKKQHIVVDAWNRRVDQKGAEECGKD